MVNKPVMQRFSVVYQWYFLGIHTRLCRQDKWNISCYTTKKCCISIFYDHPCRLTLFLRQSLLLLNCYPSISPTNIMRKSKSHMMNKKQKTDTHNKEKKVGQKLINHKYYLTINFTVKALISHLHSS